MTGLSLSRWEQLLLFVVVPIGIVRWVYVGEYLTAAILFVVTVGYLAWRRFGGDARIFDM